MLAATLLGCQNNTIELDGGTDETEGEPGLTSTGPGDPDPVPVSTGPVTTTPNTTSPDTGWTDDGWDTDWTDDGWDTDWTDDGWDTDWTDDGWDTDWTGGPIDTDGAPELSFFADVAPILQATCAPNCHEPGGEWPLIDMLNSPWFALVGVPSSQNPLMNYVEPGEPENSYLWHKISGTQIAAGGSGLTMPKEGALTDDEHDTIVLWIFQGALNN